MNFTNSQEVRQHLDKLCDAKNMSSEELAKAMEKISWWIGFLEGYIGKEKLEEISK